MIYSRIAIDCVVIGYSVEEDSFKILLVQRSNEPKKGAWALPGGFVKQTETFEVTAKHILKKETGIRYIFIDQLKAYSLTGCEDSNRIISIAFFSIVNMERVKIDKAEQFSKWFDLYKIPDLPFDHKKKVEDTIAYLKTHVNTQPYLFKLLPAKFTLNQLQRIYECLFNVSIDNRNFRKKAKQLAYIVQLNELTMKTSRRPAHLYKFNALKYKKAFKLF